MINKKVASIASMIVEELELAGLVHKCEDKFANNNRKIELDKEVVSHIMKNRLSPEDINKLN